MLVCNRGTGRRLLDGQVNLAAGPDVLKTITTRVFFRGRAMAGEMGRVAQTRRKP